jgi:hypothetical protein
MDQEKYEHQISQLRQRTEALERELAVLREGSNVRPLEEKIQVRILHCQAGLDSWAASGSSCNAICIRNGASSPASSCRASKQLPHRQLHWQLHRRLCSTAPAHGLVGSSSGTPRVWLWGRQN